MKIKVGRLYIRKFRHKKEKIVIFVEKVSRYYDVQYTVLGDGKLHICSKQFFKEYFIEYEHET